MKLHYRLLYFVYFQGLLPTPLSAPVSQNSSSQSKLSCLSNTNGYSKAPSNNTNNRTSNYSNPSNKYSQPGNVDFSKQNERTCRTPEKQFSWQQQSDNRSDNKSSNHSNLVQDTLGHQKNGYTFQRQKYKKGKTLVLVIIIFIS